ncbi:PAS domain-containing sensor histidine kinase [Halonotius sp. GCM10025705]|uniref:PAS domain-containing sensor histidine kinase n=1 Tax=Halonotius sp. GCM10025705 TaxID=3252678 RepID=UPI003616E59C
MTSPPNTDASNRFETLFEQLNDPVVEFKLEDGEPIIVQTNEAFREMFCTVDSVAGLPLNDLIVPADQRDEAMAFDKRTADDKSNKEIIERTTATGRRKFLYRGVPIGNDRGFAIYTDITDKYQQKRHLDVLQRVIRHNLRNDVNVISGEVERALEKAQTDQTREALETIKRKANGLTQLCTEAQTIRKVLDTSTKVEPTPIKPIFEDVSADCRRRFNNISITVDCSNDLTVYGDHRLRILIESLTDNAIRHNTSSSPRKVSLSAEVNQEGFVDLTVADNGPGIPKTEQQVITDEGEISPLSHGSGLGLWLVKWLTEEYRGTLEIESATCDGSIVCIQLPKAGNEQNND